MAVRSATVNVMAAAAMKAARHLVRDFGEVEQLQVSKKGPADFVSAADRRAEQVVQRELARARPTFGFLLEERGAIAGDDPDNRWLVDPLDGTTNFLHGIPHFAVSIAHECRGEILAGVIYNPLVDELFWAERGAGAHLNDRRLRVSARQQLGAAVVATGIPHRGRPGADAFLAQLAGLMPEVAGIRRMGSAALDLAYVAAGRYDGFWEAALSPWDIAAGILLVREAGGLVSEIDGGERMLASGSVLAANPHLYEPLRGRLREANRGAR